MQQNLNNKDELVSNRERIDKYRPIVENLVAYLPWLESKRGTRVSSTYSGDGIGHNSIPFPVYDSTLLALVKLLQTSPLMDRNYVYVYSRNRIRTPDDEMKLIHRSELKDTQDIGAVLSRYVLEGMRKGDMWTAAVSNGIFFEAITQLKNNIEYWDTPIN